MTPRPEVRHFSVYDDKDLIEQQVRIGRHRETIGGMWEELGLLQFEFLKAHGLRPENRLIDIGAGCFRAGVHIIPYLDPEHYFATDIQASLLEIGYHEEIERLGLQQRFPKANFAANGTFDISMFGQTFDVGVAQSVFSHMPAGQLRICLAAAAPYFNAGGRLFVTVFVVPNDVRDKPFRHNRSGITSFPDSDPYHTSMDELAEIAAAADGWTMDYIGYWSHPRDLQMICMTRS